MYTLLLKARDIYIYTYKHIHVDIYLYTHDIYLYIYICIKYYLRITNQNVYHII